MPPTRIRILMLAFTLLGAVAILCAWVDSMTWRSNLFVPLGDRYSLIAFYSSGRLLLGLSLARQPLSYGIHFDFQRFPGVPPGPAALFQAVDARHEADPNSDYWEVILPSWLLLSLWFLGGFALFRWLGRREACRQKLTSP